PGVRILQPAPSMLNGAHSEPPPQRDHAAHRAGVVAVDARERTLLQPQSRYDLVCDRELELAGIVAAIAAECVLGAGYAEILPHRQRVVPHCDAEDAVEDHLVGRRAAAPTPTGFQTRPRRPAE